MMKKCYPVVVLSVLVISLLYLPHISPHNETQEESQEGLDEWLRMRLADPRTGEVPLGIQLGEREFVKSILDGFLSFIIQFIELN